MPNFSKMSQERLDTCAPELQRLFNKVAESVDCTILVGHRNEEDQDKAFHEGLSKLVWPKSKHNSEPSRAVDVAPFPIDWHDTERFCYFAGFVKGIAEGLGIEIRWGGDWDSDMQVKDETFRDLVHFELAP